MSDSTYQKIQGPYKRDPKTNKLLLGEWTDPAFKTLELSDDWIFTEKIDGTNVRVAWDGYRVEVRGRTDRAEFSAPASLKLSELFMGEDKENLFEQQFGKTPAVVYGELYGPGIQRGGIYRSDLGFITFDVRVEDWWLDRENILDVADGLGGLEVVPVIIDGGLIREAIYLVGRGLASEIAYEHGKPNVFAEGLVGVTKSGLRDRRGERVAIKVKHRDFYQEV